MQTARAFQGPVPAKMAPCEDGHDSLQSSFSTCTGGAWAQNARGRGVSMSRESSCDLACSDAGGRDQSVGDAPAVSCSHASGPDRAPSHLLCDEAPLATPCGVTPAGPAPLPGAPAPGAKRPCGGGLDLREMLEAARAREARLRPNPLYLEVAAAAAAAAAMPEQLLTPQMRMVVVSWMGEAADEFGLAPETYHLSVALVDRFLSSAAPAGVPRGVLQMVSVAAIMVAAKHLEVHVPTVDALVSIAAHCFTAADLLRTERLLLDALDFAVAPVTAFTFLHLFAQGLPGLPAPVAALAMYLLDLSLIDYSLLEFAHSDLAASALALAAHTHGASHLAAHVREVAGGPLAALPRLLALHHGAAAPASEAVRDLLCPLATKYASPSWCCAARIAPLPALDPAWRL